MLIPPSATSAPLREFRFKQFQIEDYARAAMHDGVILGHDTGGGKGLALYVWPALKTGFERPSPVTHHPSPVTGLQPLAPVLLTVPGDLHKQVIDEGQEKFKAKTVVLDSQDTFMALSTVNPVNGQRELPPGYYITSYTQLGSNGVADFPALNLASPPNAQSPEPRASLMARLGLSPRHIEEYFDQRARHCKRHYQRLNEFAVCGPDATAIQLRQAWQTARRACEGNVQTECDAAYEVLKHYHAAAAFTGLPLESVAFIRDQMLRYWWSEYQQGVGHIKTVAAVYDRRDEPAGEHVSRPEPRAPAWTASPLAPLKIKCVYSPTLADLCQDSFAAVAVDEGVRMKGDDTLIGQGVRQMNPRFRLVLTATPIKNRVPDIFWLAHWVCGGHAEACARFPYAGKSAAKEQFSGEYMITERNLSAEDRSETKRRYVKFTPQVCNVHRLWKVLAPVVLRRRKKDFGEDIVPKHRHIVRVPMGTHQASVYRHHLEGEYVDYQSRPCIGPQLQALRIAAANPASSMLEAHFSQANVGTEPRSGHSYIPKLHAALKIIQQVLARGEQVVIFSAFQDSLDCLSARLNQAGVRHTVADGRMTQKKRGAAIKEFKRGNPRARRESLLPRPEPRAQSPEPDFTPVLLAGVESVAEGHSLQLCNNVILLCYSWAYDKFEQAINRAHRLNSPWPVNVFPIICDHTIDRRLEALIGEKGDAAELVLDGHLLGEHASEVNLAELLDTARKEFAASGNTIPTVDEAELEQQWPALRAELAATVKAWHSPCAPGVRPSRPPCETPVEPVSPLTTNQPLTIPDMRNNHPPYNANANSPVRVAPRPAPEWRRRCSSGRPVIVPPATQAEPMVTTVPRWRLNFK